MPISTFWNQVRLITPALEPLITLTRQGPVPRAILWPITWTDAFALEAIFPDATRAVETPPLTLMRTPLPHRLQAWITPTLPRTVCFRLTAIAPEGAGVRDERISAALLEVLAGMEIPQVVLLGDGFLLEDVPGGVVRLADHINWGQENILEGYPAEHDTPSRFIDTQTLYQALGELPATVALYARHPVMQTPSECALAGTLGAGSLTGEVAQLALLAHFKGMRVRAALRGTARLVDGRRETTAPQPAILRAALLAHS